LFFVVDVFFTKGENHPLCRLSLFFLYVDVCVVVDF